MLILLYNAKIYVEKENFQEAVLVDDGIIKKVGKTDDLSDEFTVLSETLENEKECKKIDCNGNVLIPGLNDSHLHFMQMGESMNQVNIDGVTSIDEIVQRCKNFMNQNPHRVRNGIHAIGWNQDLFTDDDRIPNRHDLDKISCDIPIVLERVCGHIVSTNTKTIEILNIDANSPQFPDGEFLLGDDGFPNGIFTANACNFAKAVIPDFTIDERRDMLVQSMKLAASYGLTSVQSNDIGTTFMDGPAAFKLLKDIFNTEDGIIRYRHQVCFNDIDIFKDYVNNGEFATGKYKKDDMLTLGPLKLFKDGSLGARTALMRENYKDDPENFGLQWIKDSEMREYCKIAKENKMQIITHAIGDRAIQDTIKCYEEAFIDGENKLRHAIVHCQITDEGIIDEISKKDICVMAQPIFLDYDMKVVESRCGKELSSTSYAFNTLKKRGVHVAYGTDCPVESCNPFPNIYMAVTRRDMSGNPREGFYSQECVSVSDAIDAYTFESAYLEFMEDKKGRIKKDFFADMVLLDRDIFEISHDEIKDTVPLFTMVNGKIVYKSDNFKD